MKSIGFTILIVLCFTVQVLASDDSTKAVLADTWFEQAQTIRYQNPDSAIELLRHSFNNYIEIGDTSHAIQVLMLSATTNGHQANYKDSYDKLWKALILADKANMVEEKAHIYIAIGRYYSFYRRRTEALHYFNLSLNINKQLVAEGVLPKANLAQNYYAFCATFRIFNEPALGQTYLDSCLWLYAPGLDNINPYRLKLEQAFLLHQNQKYAEALAMYLDIQPWFDENLPANRVLLYTYIGDTYRALAKYSESETYYKTALDISDRHSSHIDFTPLIYEKLAQLYVVLKEFPLAYENLNKAKELDAMFFDSRSENNRPLLEIQDEFRKEQENREKRLQEQRLVQLEHEDQVLFLQRTILIVSLILLVTIGIIYFNYVRSKHRAEKLEHEKAKEINQIKLRFFTNVSHEFKTPLTLIMGPLQKLIAQKHIDAGVKSSLKMMQRNANQLMHLINQIIEFRKVESAEIKLNAAFGDMVYFCRELADSFRVLADEKQITLNFESLQDEIEAWFDRDKLGKILNNLISNALKHTPEKGTVRVMISRPAMYQHSDIAPNLRSGYVELVVEDNGRGIPEDQLERVFERYYQIDTGEYAVQIGSGIGLALTRELVLLHQGEIFLQSKEGTGSRFTVRLPLGNPPFAIDQIDPDAEGHERATEVLGAAQPVVTHHDSSPKSPGLSQEQQALPVLLVIEDNPDMQVFIRDIFEEHYQVRQAENGQAGLEMAISHVPDLIISDVMMPLMDGIEVCTQVKAHTVTRHIPVILLTARSSIEHRLQGLETGADAYIPKPFHVRHLEVRVQKLLEQREALRRKYEEGNIKLDSQKYGIKEAERRFLEQAEEIIEQNLTNSEFTVVHLGQELGFSRMQLYRKLKSLTGLSANEFVRTYKIKKAAVYLRESHLNITEVLYEVGFTNRSYFSKCFKQTFGMSPREYINAHKSPHIP